MRRRGRAGRRRSNRAEFEKRIDEDCGGSRCQYVRRHGEDSSKRREEVTKQSEREREREKGLWGFSDGRRNRG